MWEKIITPKTNDKFYFIYHIGTIHSLIFAFALNLSFH